LFPFNDKLIIINFTIFLFIHVGAIFCVLFVNTICWVKLTLTICILTNLLVIIRHYVLLDSNKSIVEFWPHEKGKWYLKKSSSEVVSATISYPIFILYYLVIISFILNSAYLKVSFTYR
jgi:hypothetical protein